MNLCQLLKDLAEINKEIEEGMENLSECQAETRWSGETDYTTDYWQNKFSRMSQLRWEKGVITAAVDTVLPMKLTIPWYVEPQPVYEGSNIPCPF